MRLYFVEMPKFNKDWQDFRNTFDLWVAFLTRYLELDKPELRAKLAGDAAVAKAVVELERMGLNERERQIYDRKVDRQMQDTYQIEAAEQRGEQRGVKRMVLQLIKRRFGEVPPSVTVRLQSLSTVLLEELHLELQTLSSLADVERWLARH